MGLGQLGWPCPPHRAAHLGAAGPAGRRRDQAFLSEGQGLRTQGAGGSLFVAKSTLRVIKQCPPPSGDPAAPSSTSLRCGPILAALSHAVCNKRGSSVPLWPVVAAQAAGRFWRDWQDPKSCWEDPCPSSWQIPPPLWGTA